jgi:hypothetical protein
VFNTSLKLVSRWLRSEHALALAGALLLTLAEGLQGKKR